jgi:hypothetical protein
MFDFGGSGGKIEPPWRPGSASGDKMPIVKKGGVSAQLAESLWHLERLINLHIEWQTDWSALSPTCLRDSLGAGEPNPDFDPSYLAKLREHPEEVFNPAVLAARDFLKAFRTK